MVRLAIPIVFPQFCIRIMFGSQLWTQSFTSLKADFHQDINDLINVPNDLKELFLLRNDQLRHMLYEESLFRS